VYIPSTFVAIKSFASKSFEICAAIESEVTFQECSNGSKSFNMFEQANIGILFKLAIFFFFFYSYAISVNSNLSLRSLAMISIESIATS
jgi:hypothetical protein